MVTMIGKDLRRRAFAGIIAAAAALIALVFILGTALIAAVLLKPRETPEIVLTAPEGEAVIKSGDASLYDPVRDGEVIRLHIVANSDSSEDQRVKLVVRNEVLALARLSDNVLNIGNADAAEILLKNAGQPLMEAVRSVLKREGASYGAQLLIGDFDFPDREYGGKFYPAGKYRALRILLGDGAGKNWWCILFPPLCIINTEARTMDSQNGQNAGFADASTEYASPVREDGSIRFESLFARIFNKIFRGEEW